MALTDVQARAALTIFYSDHLSYEGNDPKAYISQYVNEFEYGRTIEYAFNVALESMLMRSLAYGNALPGYTNTPVRGDALKAAFNNASSADLLNYIYPNADSATKQALAAQLTIGSLKGIDLVNAMAILTPVNAAPTADAVKAVASQIGTGTFPSPSQVSDAISGISVPTVPTTPVDVVYPTATLHLDGISDANANVLTALYIGAFGRAPEFGGLVFWANQLATMLKSGLTDQQAYKALGLSFYKDGLTNGEGGASLSTEAFVKYAYNNSLGREPDSAGLAYWKTQIETGAVQRSDFLASFLSDALKTAVDGAYLQAKVAVAKFVAQEHVSGDKSPGVNLKTILSGVKDESTAKAAIASIEATYGKLAYGTAGVDHVSLNGSPAGFSLKLDDNFISYSNGGVKQVLIGVERLDFSDGTHLAVDFSGNAGQAYRLYNAAFDRVPDKGGLGFWIGQADKGVSMSDIAKSFTTSTEFKNMYGETHTNSEFINKLYMNVLDRAPDAVGVQFWQNQLESGAKTEAQVLFGFSESTENKIAVTGQIQNGIDYTLAV